MRCVPGCDWLLGLVIFSAVWLFAGSGAATGATPESSPPSHLKGVVLAVDDDLVEISLGDDDGLIKGHKLEVYRGTGKTAKYVGRIEVLRTTPERAACKMVKGMQKLKPQKGDYVASGLN
jgi:hypothetical protein